MRSLLLLATLLLMTDPTHAADQPSPPDVARKPHLVTAPFGATREDPYYWLRDDARKAPEMLAADKDVRYYENTEGGHGAGATNAQQGHVWALTYRFLWSQLQ